MRLIEINWDPGRDQLRQFGFISLFLLPFLGWLWSASLETLFMLSGVGLVLSVLGILSPILLKPIFVGLMFIALPIGLVVSEIALALIFFGVFLPIGLCFRIVSRDSLQRRLDRNAQSYWQEKRKPRNVSSYYHQW